MLPGLERVKSHRVWFIPGFVIWGLAGCSEIELLVCERVNADRTVLFGKIDIGDTAQSVSFADLTDHRSNNLPLSISSPRVIVRPRSAGNVFIVGDESDEGFKIARDSAGTGPVMVDLLIIEMGD